MQTSTLPEYKEMQTILFMAIPEIQQGMKKLGFESPALN